MDLSSKQIKEQLLEKSSAEKAEASAWFFKTGVGQYGEGDIFIGLTVPEQRVIAKAASGEFMHWYIKEGSKKISLDSFAWIQELLEDKIHECRLTALMILVYLYRNKGADTALKKFIYKLYILNFKNINNWDLVDTSAGAIVGGYMYEFQSNESLQKLSNWAKSEHLWTRRIAIIATQYFIGKMEFEPTLRISELLLNDRHDLIHKACGWMLREVGKKDINVLLCFLDTHHKKMPRTMLRYALEKLELDKRAFYMKK